MESIWGNIQGLLGLNQPQLNKPKRTFGPQIDLNNQLQTQIELPPERMPNDRGIIPVTEQNLAPPVPEIPFNANEIGLLTDSNRVIQNIVGQEGLLPKQEVVYPPNNAMMQQEINEGLLKEPVTNKSNVMQDVERFMPENEYKHAQRVLKGIIGKETGYSYDYLQKQRTNNGTGPGRGLIQMENGGYTYKDGNKTYVNPQPVFERWKDRWTKGMSLSDRIDLVDKAEIIEGKETFKKGMNDYYKDWLKDQEVETGNSSANQIKFLIESLKGNTDYRIGNSAKVLKALNNGTNEDSAKTAMATFIKYVTRPAWSGGKSILEIKKMKPFIETWKAGNK